MLRPSSQPNGDNLMATKFLNTFTLTLHEREEQPNGKKKNVEVGKVQIPFPTLSDFDINAQPKLGDDGKPETYQGGIPVYTDPRHNLLQEGIVNLVSIRSRNKFEKGVLKPGLSLAEDFDMLFEQSGGAGDALAMRREARTDFEKHLQGKDKKAATIALLSDLFQNSAKVLGAASETYINALSGHVGTWVASLDEAKALRFAPKIQELQDSINNAIAGDELDDLA